MEYLKEYTGEKVKGEQELFGHAIPDGDEIRIKSLANFEGYKCRIWAPEFHSLLLDSAIEQAKCGELKRSSLKYTNGMIDAMPELTEDDENTLNSYKVIQCYILTIYACISAAESWVNKAIYELKDNKVNFARNNLDREEVAWGAKKIEKYCGLSEKLFIVFPAIYQKRPIKEHVTSRTRFEELISDRNTVIHIKNSPRISGGQMKRKDLSLKMLRRNVIYVPKNSISMIKMLHDHCELPLPLWLVGNIAKLETIEREQKNIN